MSAPLDGIRVLDFTRVLAGPLCTQTLADLGADVLKIESPDGDDTRGWAPPYVGDAQAGMSAYFASVNRGKRSLVLDLRQPAQQAAARALALKADVLIENFKAGTMARFGLDFAALRADHPALVYASITGFGQVGAYADRPGYDAVIQAMSGLMAITGSPEGEPMKIGVALTDVIAGLYATSAILAALHRARASGRGDHLDIALYDTTLASLVNIAAGALATGGDPARQGNAHPSIVPYQTFAASDGSFMLACGSDRQFRALAALIGQPALADDPRFANNPARVQHRAALIALLDAAFATSPCDHWVSACLGAGIPAGAIQSVTTALHDPGATSRDLVMHLEPADRPPLAVVRYPVLFADGDLPAPTYPPRLDEGGRATAAAWGLTLPDE